MNLLSDGLLFIGALFIFIASLGIVRMPDLFLRMHASAKAGTLGAGLILSGAVTYFSYWKVTLEVLVAIIFLVLTAPVAFHLLGRAAFRHAVDLDPATKKETDLAKNYPEVHGN